MWRYLYNEYPGVSDAVRLGGARSLQEWTRCTKIEGPSAHLDDLVECLQTLCSELLAAPGILRTMIFGIIPSDFEHKLLAKPHIKTWQEIGQWGNIQTLYKRQEVSAEAARRPGGSRINSVLANIEPVNADTGDRIHLPPRPDHQPGFQEYIHALNQGNPKGPRPPGSPRGPLPPGGQNGPRPGGTKIRINFKGCWHCGKDGHSLEVVQSSKNSCLISTRANLAKSGISRPILWQMRAGEEKGPICL